jgi:DNA-directed RNA polymerase subunit RPC12/RpoP
MQLSMLQQEEIQCYLKDEFTNTINPILSNAIGGIKLMVLDIDFERAKILLAEINEQYKRSVICPQCGSSNVQYINKPDVKNWLTALFTWLLGNYAISAEQIYHCYNCGFEFEDLPDKETEVNTV